jgi:hypothetical protein
MQPLYQNTQDEKTCAGTLGSSGRGKYCLHPKMHSHAMSLKELLASISSFCLAPIGACGNRAITAPAHNAPASPLQQHGMGTVVSHRLLLGLSGAEAVEELGGGHSLLLEAAEEAPIQSSLNRGRGYAQLSRLLHCPLACSMQLSSIAHQAGNGKPDLCGTVHNGHAKHKLPART